MRAGFEGRLRRRLLVALVLSGALAELAIAEAAGNAVDREFFYYDYSDRDHEVVDYRSYSLPGVPLWKFRGPRPSLQKGEYFSAIGAAQTMGVLIEKPYPSLLAEELGWEALNLGLGGGSPSAFAEEEALIDLINGGKFLILQVMRASAEANSRFEPTRQLGLVKDVRTAEAIPLTQAWAAILQEEPSRAPLFVAESQNSWVEAYLDLLAKVEVPVILFWFAPREVDVPEPDFGRLLGNFSPFVHEYPSMVDAALLERVRKLCGTPDICAAYVEVRSDRGREFDFISRFTGEPTEIDYSKMGLGELAIKKSRNTATSYWSQEMHQDAVAPLLEAIQGLDL